MADQRDLDERKFIHDISNPLSIADGKARILAKKIAGGADKLEPGYIEEQLGKISHALGRMANLIRERREVIKKD